MFSNKNFFLPFSVALLHDYKSKDGIGNHAAFVISRCQKTRGREPFSLARNHRFYRQRVHWVWRTQKEATTKIIDGCGNVRKSRQLFSEFTNIPCRINGCKWLKYMRKKA